MSEKKVNAAAFFFFTLALIGVVAAWYTVKDTGSAQSGAEQKYESTVFGQNVVQIDIVTDEDTWQSILDNALEEQYTAVSVTINGKTYDNVGIRPKGNSTLTRVASSDSDRFSFKIKFDEYIDDMTLDGLDVLVLNNIIDDNSYIKEYIAFDMMNYLGVPSSLYTYASLSLNGENIGFYLALEGYNDSFEMRNFGREDGEIYSAKSMEMGGGMGGRQDFAQRPTGGEFTSPDMTGENTDTTENQNGDTGENSAQFQRPTGGNFTPPDMTGENTDTTENQNGDTGENFAQLQRPTDGEFTPPDITGEDGESFTPPDMGSMPNRFENQDQTAQSGAAAIYQQYQIPIMLAVTVIVMVFALIFAYRFGRKRR